MGTVNNAMYFNSFATDDVECEIGFQNKDAVSCIFEFIIMRCMAKEWIIS